MLASLGSSCDSFGVEVAIRSTFRFFRDSGNAKLREEALPIRSVFAAPRIDDFRPTALLLYPSFLEDFMDAVFWFVVEGVDSELDMNNEDPYDDVSYRLKCEFEIIDRSRCFRDVSFDSIDCQTDGPLL